MYMRGKGSNNLSDSQNLFEQICVLFAFLLDFGFFLVII